MNVSFLSHRLSLYALTGLCGLALAGCQDLFTMSAWNLPTMATAKKKSDPIEKVDEEASKAGRTPLVGDYTSISGNSMIILQGVGLVVGLDNTGGDLPPSQARRTLVEDMKVRRIPDINRKLQSPSTAAVIVTGYVPPLSRKGDRFDVEVRLPEGSEATSLNGGWLLPCRLVQKALVPGRGFMDGDELAIAEGPILLSSGEGDASVLAGVLQRGDIPGGARYIGDQLHLAVNMKSEYRSVRMATRIADAIGKRFHHFDEYGIRKALADPKTDTRIELELHPRYRNNYPRFIQCVRHIAFRETPIERRLRMERLGDDIMRGDLAERAAIELEAIGSDAIPVLKDALHADNLESRFHAAIALTYLGDGAGVPVLAEAARDERAFRAYAFAAMSALETGEALPALRELLSAPSIETRYGALRAITELTAHDPAVESRMLNNSFIFRVIDSGAEPMIHLTKRRKAEISLFNPQQRFTLPITVRAGTRIWVTSPPGSHEIVVSRYEPGKEDQRKVVSPRVADVILAVASMDASYPDIVQMLVQAERQANLPGTIAIDALPRAGRTYVRRSNGAEGGREARIGSTSMEPNLFVAGEDEEETATNEDDAAAIEFQPDTPAVAPEPDVQFDAAPETKPLELERSEYDGLELLQRNSEKGTRSRGVEASFLEDPEPGL